MAKIAFIGTGVMGAAMAGHLMDAGHDLIVYNRTKSKTDGLVARGATYAENPQKAAAQAEFVVILRTSAKFILVQKEFSKMIVQEKFLLI